MPQFGYQYANVLRSLMEDIDDPRASTFVSSSSSPTVGPKLSRFDGTPGCDVAAGFLTK